MRDEVKGRLRGLVGHYVIISADSPSGELTVGGVLEEVSDGVIVLRQGRVRRFITNVVVVEVIDCGV